MGAKTGIGAAVRRKEDFRFVTGKGQYTGDIDRPGIPPRHREAAIRRAGAERRAA